MGNSKTYFLYCAGDKIMSVKIKVDEQGKVKKYVAINSLVPNAEYILRDDILEWKDTKKTAPSDEEIEAELEKLQAEFDSQQYARTRATLYPNIGDQLDDLYKQGAFSSDMTAQLKKVKDDNPKS